MNGSRVKGKCFDVMVQRSVRADCLVDHRVETVNQKPLVATSGCLARYSMKPVLLSGGQTVPVNERHLLAVT